MAYTDEKKKEWQRKRMLGELERGVHSKSGPVAQYLRLAPTVAQNRSSVAHLNKIASLGLHSSDALKAIEKIDKVEQVRKQKNVHHIHADDLDSSVFASAEWKGGVATLEFWRGGDLVYDYPMDKDEFLDFLESGSLGAYFNDNIRE